MTSLIEPSSATGRLRPDDVPQFRHAQLLLLLTEANKLSVTLDLHRLGVTDFAASHPLLILQPSDITYRRLRLAGFTDHPLSNAAPGQRYATRRERLVEDLSRLISLGLARMGTANARRVFLVTDSGSAIAEQLTSVYADAYRSSAQLMLARIARLNDTALQRELSDWLRADPVMFDLLGVDAELTLFGKPK
ncbi:MULTISPECIES: ABC-three component system middle component 2 [Nocardiaceae]|uniref:MarR family transcriptional regulator n=1 Tax=Rhodococcoides corynebacterioides TaxID=53972 RepID=A0ABS2KQH0_9NOCA|nr:MULTISPECIES: ABC-three component system middle component 2 [Rhodococcus]MBM7414203.1 hypothetical protein [Rhodococcus corynebacterioides]MBP1116666.1 hypothetical protein [Rhodococcus sp. PvP016]